MSWFDTILAVVTLPIIWQSTVWLGMALALSRWLRRHSALAHAVLFLSLIGAVVTPLASALVQSLGWGILARHVVTLPEGWNDGLGIAGLVSGVSWVERLETGLMILPLVLVGLSCVRAVRSFYLSRRVLTRSGVWPFGDH